MMCAAFGYRVPREGWKPAGWEPPAEDKQKSMITQHHVHIDEALKTRQFYQLWVILCFNVTAGIGVLGVAKTMMSEIFGSTLPHIVDAAFASTYVLMISLFNMIGRIFWASSSPPASRAPASLAASASSPSQNAITVISLPIPCGSDTAPRTI